MIFGFRIGLLRCDGFFKAKKAFIYDRVKIYCCNLENMRKNKLFAGFV